MNDGITINGHRYEFFGTEDFSCEGCDFGLPCDNICEVFACRTGNSYGHFERK